MSIDTKTKSISADVTKIRQILLNLLSNATKFTKEGDINILVNDKPDDDSILVIKVSDSGIGMTAEQVEKVFKPFFSFHIPIFFGARGLYRVLKKLGFYLFDDLIDLSFDNIQDNGERFYMAFDQIYHIKGMGKRKLHNYYGRKHKELLHNFNLLKKLSDSQLKNLNKLIYDNK